MNRWLLQACLGFVLLGGYLDSRAERYALVPDQVIDGVQDTAQVEVAVLVEGRADCRAGGQRSHSC